MSQIKVNEKIEGFELKDQNDNVVNMETVEEDKILFSWHPLAWTGICAQQMKDLDARYDKFMEMGIRPFGLSIDHSPTKKAWSDNLGIKKLQLLCDFWPHGDLAKKLGIFHENFGFSGRINILLDGNGKILLVKKYQIKEQPDFDELISMIKEL